MPTYNLSAQKGVAWFVSLLVISAILIYLFFYSEIGESRVEYTVKFSAADSLDEGMPVVIKSVNIGKVKHISYNGEDSFLLARLSINSKYKIAKDAKVRIASIDLFGGVGVEITPSNNTEYYKVGDTIIAAKTNTLKNLFKDGNTSSTTLKIAIEGALIKNKLNELQDLTKPYGKDTVIP